MNAPTEVQFRVDDRVLVRGTSIGLVIVVYRDRGQALVGYADGDRQLVPLSEIRIAPEGAVDLRERFGT